MPVRSVTHVIRDFESLAGDRGTFDSHWQQCDDYILCKRDFTVTQTPGSKRMRKVYDSTAIWANEQLASGLHGLLTSPSAPWFFLRTLDDQLNQDDDVIAWLEDNGQRMYNVFNSSAANFNPQAHEIYLDIGAFGTGVMTVLEEQGVKFQARALGENYLKENSKGRVDANYRKFELNTTQALQEFGASAPQQIKDAVDKQPYDRKWQFIHATYPRDQFDPQRADNMNMPWETQYICLTTKTFIRASGYREFPYMTPRWSKITGETYGRGPGMIALPDIQMINEMSKTSIRAAQKAVDPPLMVPDDGFLWPIRTVPSGLNFYRSGTNDRIEPIKNDARFDISLEMMDQRRQAILRTFYVDWLAMPEDQHEGSRVTAQWVRQRRDEKMTLMGPMLARLQSEFLGPLIERVFNIMMRARAFSPPPANLSGKNLRIEYVSPVAKAQRAVSAEGVMRLFELMAPVTQADPSSMKVINSEELARYGGDVYDVPHRIFRTRKEMEAQRQAAADEARQQMEVQKAGAIAAAGKDAAGAVADLSNAQGQVPQAGGGASA